MRAVADDKKNPLLFPPNTQVDVGPLSERLEALYERYNRREYVEPDPLQFLYAYPDLRDREIVGMIAAALAFGNVKQITRSVAIVLEGLPAPHEMLSNAAPQAVRRWVGAFRHRYVGDEEVADLLIGMGGVLKEYGSLEACFAVSQATRRESFATQHGLGDNEMVLMNGLVRFVAALRSHSQLPSNYLLPDPAKGSACKRLFLFLRWMVRSDAVDPGGWACISPADLVVPLDTHMHRIARALGLTQRRAADLRTAIEVTRAFRRIAPSDPVRYDFALTRLGIRTDTDLFAFLGAGN